MRAAEAHKKNFTFLSPEEDRELSLAMKKIRQQMDNSDSSTRKSAVRDDALDPRLVYAWWERNFDEAFTRQSRKTTENEATLACAITGKPELATFKAEFESELTRTVKAEEIEECFTRLWAGAQRQCQRQKVVDDALLVPLVSPTNHNIKPPCPSQVLRLSELSRPKKPSDWLPPVDMTFLPKLAGGAKAAQLRKKMTTSLPPIDSTPKRPPKKITIHVGLPPPSTRVRKPLVDTSESPETETVKHSDEDDNKETRKVGGSDNEEDEKEDDDEEEDHEEEGEEEDEEDEEDEETDIGDGTVATEGETVTQADSTVTGIGFDANSSIFEETSMEESEEDNISACVHNSLPHITLLY